MAQKTEERRLVSGEVMALLQERDRVQGWIEKLVELEGETSAAVYGKVMADYRERLRDLAGQLLTHRESVQASVDEVREQLARLAQEREERAGALEEAKLRFSVGEFDEAEWERHRETDGEALAELEQRLATEEEAREELERILAALPVTRSEDAPAGEPSASRGVETGSDPAAVSGVVGAYVAGPPARAPETPSAGAYSYPMQAGEPAAGAAAPQPPAAEPAGQAAAESFAEPPEGGYLDELAFLESLSLDETERFDAVSAMLEEGEEEGEAGGTKERPA